MYRRRAFGIGVRKELMECLHAVLFGVSVKLAADIFVAARRRKLQSGDEGIHIKSRSAADDRHSAPCGDAAHRRGGGFNVIGERIGLADIAHIDHMVGDFGALRGGGLCRADIHASVKLHGVGGDNLPAERSRALHCGGAFAGGGRSGDAEDSDFIGHGLFSPRFFYKRR